MSKDRQKHDDKRSLREKRRALERSLDAVAKEARRIAEQRARAKSPELFGDR